MSASKSTVESPVSIRIRADEPEELAHHLAPMLALESTALMQQLRAGGHVFRGLADEVEQIDALVRGLGGTVTPEGTMPTEPVVALSRPAREAKPAPPNLWGLPFADSRPELIEAPAPRRVALWAAVCGFGLTFCALAALL